MAETSEKKTPAARRSVAKKPVVAQDSAAWIIYLYDLHPVPGSNKSKMRVGRGESSKGRASRRGTRGTKARYQVSTRFEGGQTFLHMRPLKLRDFKNPFHVEYQIVNLDRLGEAFPEGNTLTIADLVVKGLVRRGEPVKMLDNDEAGAKFDLTVDV